MLCLAVVQPIVHRVATRTRLICRGRRLKDEDTPAGKAMVKETLLHVVLSALDRTEVMTIDALKANCRYVSSSRCLFSTPGRELTHPAGGVGLVVWRCIG